MDAARHRLPRLRRDEVASIPPDPIALGPIQIDPLAYFSQRGAALTGLELGETFIQWLPFLIAGLIGAGVVWAVRTQNAKKHGVIPAGRIWQSALVLIAIAAR